MEQSTDGPHEGGAGPNVGGVGAVGAAGYGDLDMDDVNSEGDDDDEDEEDGAAADDLEESETEAVWSDGDLNLSANNF